MVSVDTSIELHIPLNHSTSVSNRILYRRDHPMVTVRCSGGSHGMGFYYVVNPNGRLMTKAMSRLLGPVLIV